MTAYMVDVCALRSVLTLIHVLGMVAGRRARCAGTEDRIAALETAHSTLLSLLAPPAKLGTSSLVHAALLHSPVAPRRPLACAWRSVFVV
jgi:hypothetical protein